VENRHRDRGPCAGSGLDEVLARRFLTMDAARPDKVARRHAASRRTARENIADLVDRSSFVDYGGFATAAREGRRHQGFRGDHKSDCLLEMIERRGPVRAASARCRSGDEARHTASRENGARLLTCSKATWSTDQVR
jgi:hypothetical protein